MAIDSMNVELNLDAKEFSDGLKSAVSLIKKLDAAIAGTDERVKRNQSVIRSWAKAVRGSLTELHSLVELTRPLTDGIVSVTTSFIRANAEFEKTTAILGGLNGSAATVSEATLQLSNEIARLEKLAKTTPFTMQALQNSMVKLKAGGVDNLDFSMQALIDSVAKFGGGANELDRASIAIQQMAGKGVVSMEELRQQLGEAVPNAMALMARGLNVSMAELADLVESGTLEATSALNAMFTQMALENTGSAEDMMKTWDGTMSQISARINEIMRAMGDAGLFEELKMQAMTFLDFINQPETLDFFVELAKDMTDLIQGTVAFIKEVDKLNITMDILRDIVIAIAFVKFKNALSSIGKSARAAVDGLDDMIQAVKGIGAPITTMNAQLDKQKKLTQATIAQFGFYNASIIKATDRAKRKQIVLQGLNGVMKATGSLMATVGRSALALAGPIGAAVAIVIELASAFNLFGNEVDNIRERASDRTMAITSKEYSQLADDVENSKEKIKGLNKELLEQRKIVESSSYGSAAGSTAALAASNIAWEIAELEKNVEEGGEALKVQTKLIASDAARTFANSFSAAFELDDKQIRLDYEKSLKAIEDVRTNPGTLSGKALVEELNRMKEEADKTYVERRVAAANALAEDLKIARKTEVEKADINQKARDSELKGIDIGYREQMSKTAQWEKDMLENTAKIREQGIKTLSVSDNFWTKAYESAFVDLAGWEAKLEGGNVRYAKTLAKNALLKERDAFYTQEQAEALGVEVEEIKKAISTRKDLESIQEKSAQSTAKLTRELQEQTNPYLSSIFSLEEMDTTLQDLMGTQTEWILSTGKVIDLTKEREKAIAAVTKEMTAQSLLDMAKETSEIQKQTEAIIQQSMSETELAEFKKQKSMEEIQNLREAAEALTVYSRQVKDPEVRAAILDQAQAFVELSNVLGKPQPTFWTGEYESAFVELAGLQAKLEGNNVRYAKSLAKNALLQKKDANYTQAQAEALAQEAEKINQVISTRKELNSIQESSIQSMAKLTKELNAQTNPYLASIESLKSMNDRVKELTNTQSKWVLESGKVVSLSKEKKAAIAAVTAEMKTQSLIDIRKQTEQIKEQTSELNQQKMSEKELSALKRQKSMEEIQNLRSAAESLTVYSRQVKDPEVRAELLAQAEAYINLSKVIGKQPKVQETALSSMLDNWGNVTMQMDNLWVNTMSQMSSSLADFVVKGKADFESLANMILKSIVQITIQAAASNIFGQYLGIGVGAAASGGGVAAAPSTSAVGTQSIQSFGAAGAAPAAASIGNFRSPELGINSAIATSATNMNNNQMAPSVAVNVINETGTEADAEQGGMKFNGEQWVLDVVMKAMNRPGSFRSSMKGNTRQ